MPQDNILNQIIAYMKSHWPSDVKEEWQVALDEYPAILERVLADFTKDKTTSHHLIRIAGLSGSGKTTQLLPAVEAYCEKQGINPVLVAARRFAPYHPHYQEISDFYGEAHVRAKTDEFSTIMMFLTIKELTSQGYDIILDVTLLDPAIEAVLLGFLAKNRYDHFLVMIAISPAIAEKHLGNRSWRHTKATEEEFIRATKQALTFYQTTAPDTRIILWNTYEEQPIYDGPVKDSLAPFTLYSEITNIPAHDESILRKAKITYLTNL